MRLRFLIPALALALQWNAFSMSISIEADLLKDASGNPMPVSGLVVLVASTNDSTFNAPTPLSFASGDDVVIGKWDLSSFNTPGVLNDFVNTTTPVSSSNPLRLYWYPTLNINSTAPGQNTPYGTYRTDATVDGSDQGWFGNSPSANYTLKFLTMDANPSYDVPSTVNPASAGLASLVTPSPITISSNPTNTTQGVGNLATFSVSATGNSLQYKWRKNGVNLSDIGNISGSSTATLSISNVQVSDAASYSVYLTSTDSFTTSSSATLTVLDPYFTANPANASVGAGDLATFNATAVGTGSLTYRWKKGGANLSNGLQASGSTVSGATSTTLSIANAQSGDVDTYTLVATGSNGSATSSGATLSVTLTPVNITAPASDSVVSFNTGDSTTLSVTATGSAPITYHWRKGAVNLSNGSLANRSTISGATSPTLSLTGLYAADAGVYTCVAHNGAGDSTSHSTTISVADPIITTQPVGFTAQCGAGWPCLTVIATGTTNLTYQWYTPNTSGTAIANETNATLCLTNTFASAGSYAVVVSNALGNSITSSVVAVTVQDTNAPVITLNGTNPQPVCLNGSYVESGASALDSCDGIVSATPSGTVDPNTLGTYTVTYTAFDSHNNTNTAYRTVIVQVCGDPAITQQPQSQTVIVKQKGVTFTVGATGTGTLHYQWHFNGTNGSVKAYPLSTSPTLTLGSITPGFEGSYYCFITSANGGTNTSNAYLKVYYAPSFTPITGQPGNVKKIAGNIATFAASVGPAGATDPTLGGPVTFTWYKNGSLLPIGDNVSVANTANKSILTIMNIQTNDAATYQCLVSNKSTVTILSTNTHGILTVLTDSLPPAPSIVHPGNGLKTTNGLAVMMGANQFQTNNAPVMDIDGTASDKGLITNVTLLRTNPVDSLSNIVALYYRTNTAGVMFPGSVKWTNHVTLLPGTNTFIAIASDSAGNPRTSAARTYYFFTNGSLTVNAFNPTFGTVSGMTTFGIKPFDTLGASKPLPMNIGFRITATPKSGKHFQGWYDGDGNALSGATPTASGGSILSFVVTNANQVINANFLP